MAKSRTPKSRKSQPEYKYANETERATHTVVGDRVNDLTGQIASAVKLLRAEMRNTTGEANRNAARALAELRKEKQTRGIQKDASINPAQAKELLRVAERTRVVAQAVIRQNSRIKDADGNTAKGTDGKTITDRAREQQADIGTKEDIVGILEEINASKREALGKQADEAKNLKSTLRQGLSAFLGPAGPLIETFVSLKDEYKDDILALGKRIKGWTKTEKEVLSGQEKESARDERRNRKLFVMLGTKFAKFGSMLGGGGLLGNLADTLLDAFGLGGGKKGAKNTRGQTLNRRGSTGKGGMFTKLKRSLRRVPGLRRAGRVAKGVVGKGVNALSKVGGIIKKGFIGIGGKIVGKTLGRLIPFIGPALFAADLVGDKDAGANGGQDAVDTGISYAGGALGGASTGAAIGTFIFPVVGSALGGAIGAVVGLIFTAISRNWTAFKQTIADTWDSIGDKVSSGLTSVSEFASSLVGFIGDRYEALKQDFSNTLDWLSKKVPGFGAVVGGIRTALEIKDRVKDAVVNTAVDVGKRAAQTASDIGSAAVNVVTGAGAAVAAGAGAAVDRVVQAAPAAVATVAPLVERAATAVSGAADAVTSAPQVVPTPMGAAVGAVGAAAKGIGNFAKGVGNQAILEQQARAAGITDPSELAMFMAQNDHESGGFKRLSENMNYTSVKRIREVFGKNAGIAGLSDEQVAALVKNPEGLANIVYADKNRGRAGKVGNTEEGDGYRYRARGFIGLTGRANYAKYGKLLGIDLVGNPDLASDPTVAAQISTAYWKENKLAKSAQMGDVKGVTKGINGGDNGIKDREEKYKKYPAQFKGGDGDAIAPVGDGGQKIAASSVVAGADDRTTGYPRASSVGRRTDTTVTMAADKSSAALPVSGVSNQRTTAKDIPLVLGDNHMVVINAGMMGA